MLFSVIIHFKAYHTIIERSGLVEERVILLTADSLSEAAKKARAYAIDEEVEFSGEGDDTIAWKLERIICVQEVTGVIGPTPCEILSRHLSASEALSVSLPFQDP